MSDNLKMRWNARPQAKPVFGLWTEGRGGYINKITVVTLVKLYFVGFYDIRSCLDYKIKFFISKIITQWNMAG